ncbi:hypothetical protein Ndes2526B_g01554 [Nannochloris sp. 'desiccata']
MPQMVLDGMHVRFCQHCGRFQPLQEFDHAFKSCRKSLQRHRKSQSRRIRTKTSTKASSGSDEFSGGSRKPGKKFEGRTGGRNSTYSNSSMNNTDESNNNDDTQSPYDGSTPNGSGIQTQSIDGSPGDGSGLERQQFGCSCNGIVPPGVAQPLSSAPNGTANNSARTTEDAPSHTQDILDTRSLGGGGGGDGITPLPIPSTNVVSGTLLEQVSQIDLLPIDDLFDFDDILVNPTDWIPDLSETADHDGILANPHHHHHPRLAPLPSAAVGAARGGTEHARATASLLANGHGQHRYNQHAPTISELGPNVSNCSLDQALNLVTFEYPNTLGDTHDGSTVVRASLKLFNTRPENLPLTVREALMEVMAASDTFLTANTRPGCVHITANVVLKKSEAQAVEARGAKGLLTNALAQGTRLIPAECTEGPRCAFLAQLNVQIAALGTGGTISSISLDSTSDATSEICAVVPLAMTSTSPQNVTLLGRSISGDLDMVVCRRGKDTPNLGVTSSGPSQRLQEGTTSRSTATTAGNTASTIVTDDNGASGSWSRSHVNTMTSGNLTPRYPPGSFTGKGLAAGEYVQFSLMEVKEGLHDIEIQKGSLLSPSAQSLLVIDDAAVVAEVRQLEVDSTGVSNIPAFVQAIGIVVEHLECRREGRHHPNGSVGVAQRIAPLAAAIITVAVARKWPAMLRLICPAASPADVQAQITAVSSTTDTNTPTPSNNNDNSTNDDARVSNTIEGLTLLHMVAASGCVEFVEAIEEWGRAAGHMWVCQPTGTAQITPLHIAAILDDNAAMANALTTLFGTSCHHSWYYAKAADGVTPAQAAKIAENEAVLQFLREQLPLTETLVSLPYDNEDSACSSLCASTGGGGGGATEISSGLQSLHRNKFYSDSLEELPSCPDEWPYRLFYGTNGLLLQRSSTENASTTNIGSGIPSSPEITAAAGGGNHTTNIDPSSSADAVKSIGLGVRGAGATAVGMALGFVAGIGALAVRYYCEVRGISLV